MREVSFNTCNDASTTAIFCGPFKHSSGARKVLQPGLNEIGIGLTKITLDISALVLDTNK